MEVLSATSVRVSWKRIEVNIQTIYYSFYGYQVYYSQKGRQGEEVSVTVQGTENNVVIEDLISDVKFLFQVVSIVRLNGKQLIMGMRSSVVEAHTSVADTCKLIQSNESSDK